MKTTKIDLKKVLKGENPLINAMWLEADKREEEKVWEILSNLKLGN